jgi:hypothetical protein
MFYGDTVRNLLEILGDMLSITPLVAEVRVDHSACTKGLATSDEVDVAVKLSKSYTARYGKIARTFVTFHRADNDNGRTSEHYQSKLPTRPSFCGEHTT